MMNRQIRLVGVGICVLFLALFVQLNYLQVFHASKLQANENNTVRIIGEYNKPRGAIMSADGQQLAFSKTTGSPNFKYQRVYPQAQLFADVTGYFSYTYGSDGVEKTYDSFLTGSKTSFVLPNSLSGLKNDLTNGSKAQNVNLTISTKVQQAAAAALGSQNGAVVALDPTTGAILAMYSNPAYDPNQLALSNQQQVQANYRNLVNNSGNPLSPSAYRNRFPPGSTFKIVTSAAAYDRNQQVANKSYPVEGSISLPGTNQRLHNFGSESCGGPLLQTFTTSCDTAFASMGLDMGAGSMAGEAQGFGFGKALPFDLPGTATSNFPAANSFNNDMAGLAKSAIGQQDVSASPLDMALVASAIANGGTIMTPHVLNQVTNAQNQVISTYKPKPWEHATSPDTAGKVTKLMQSVVSSGTGTAAAIPGVPVAGKTGTAQTGGNNTDYWFTCFAPAQQPKIAVAVLVEGQGTTNEFQGGTVAAPIAKKVLQAALPGMP